MSDINQDDIDKLLQAALVGGDAEEAAAPASTPAKPEAPAPAADASGMSFEGIASNDDIDALFAAVGGGGADAVSAAPAAASQPAEKPVAAAEESGIANQDDIDALFSAVGGTAAPEADVSAVQAPSPPSASPADGAFEGIASNDDIDALFAAVTGGDEGVDAASGTDTQILDEGGIGQDDINALFADPAGTGEDAADLDSLLSSLDGEAEAAPVVPAPAPTLVDHGERKDETIRVDSVDMEELLRQVTDAAPPPPPHSPPSPQPKMPDNSIDTAILPPDVSQMLAQAGGEAAFAPSPSPLQSLPPVPPPAAAPASLMPAGAVPPPPAGARRDFSVLYGAGEVDSVAGQINALLSSMSEKAHSYMQAWIAADSEAKELRVRALAEERRRASLEGEKSVLARELDDLRTRLGELEGGKIAAEESKRTLETSFQAKIRELESQVTLFASETESLKNELTRARNEATGVDIESRRTRFEADRLKNEAESERMERLRIQRALENREKELQAMQAQSSGQASSLFIDELHRLVRRLESELDARAAGAHEALKQLDRLETPESMVPVAANLRAALMQALGADDDQEDALKSLGREASGVRGPAAVEPGKAEVVSFETALSTYNLAGAIDVAGTLIREARATPGLLMRKVYQCPALRRPEMADHLGDLARLLEGLRTVQESNDRSRGSESGESEVFYVHMFDFLHNLVRLKLINRLTGDIWRIFLDLRGRFSFVTSDKQWAEYRDSTLAGKNQKA